MKCIDPVKLKDQELVVPCGRCNFCLSRRRQEWTFRLKNEFMASDNGYFITLTYDDEYIHYGNRETGTLYKKDLQNFHKSLKRNQVRNYGKDVKCLKWYGVGEYGSIGKRPHYHSLLFNLYPHTINRIPDTWNKGHIKLAVMNHERINYTAGYLIDLVTDYQGDQKPFAMMSKGLGANYLDKNFNWHKEGQRNYVKDQGIAKALPRYYKDKIFDKNEKALFHNAGIKQDNIKYFEEVERLSKFGVVNPDNYLKCQKIDRHNRIKFKSNENKSL